MPGMGLVLLGLLLFTDQPTRDWPRFRGPNGSGQGSGFHWPQKWDDSVIRWKVDLPGEGHGSPIVHSGRLYLPCSSKDGAQRSLLCLDANDGKQLWRQNMTGHKSAMHKKNSFASGSAATDGETVCCCHWDGSTVTLSAYACQDGKSLWTVPLGDYESQHGPGHSPIMHQGKILVHFDSDKTSEVMCFDGKSGRKLWSRPRTVYRANYSTPILRQANGITEAIIASTPGITAYELETGKIQWHWPWPFAQKPLRAVSSPVLIEGDMLLAACGDGGGDRDTVMLKLPATGPAGKEEAPQLIWQLRRDVPYVTCLLAHAGRVYYIADKGVAGCLDLNTGRDEWQHRLNGNFTASPLLIDNRIVAINEEGDFFVFAADPRKLQSAFKWSLHDQVYATPALASGYLYIRGQHTLYCVGAQR